MIILGSLLYAGIVVFYRKEKIHIDDLHQESVVEKLYDSDTFVSGSVSAITKNPAHTPEEHPKTPSGSDYPR